jgi:hypothetical protein
MHALARYPNALALFSTSYFVQICFVMPHREPLTMSSAQIGDFTSPALANRTVHKCRADHACTAQRARLARLADREKRALAVDYKERQVCAAVGLEYLCTIRQPLNTFPSCPTSTHFVIVYTIYPYPSTYRVLAFLQLIAVSTENKKPRNRKTIFQARKR